MTDQIRTTYNGPVGLKGSRITARFVSGPHKGRRKTVGYDHAARDPHSVAAHELIRQVNKLARVDEGSQTYVENLADYVGTYALGNCYAAERC
jgi:hypothetical protein